MDTSDVITCIPETLKKDIKSKQNLRIKFGADPSMPDLHLGHMVVLKQLQKLQKL